MNIQGTTIRLQCVKRALEGLDGSQHERHPWRHETVGAFQELYHKVLNVTAGCLGTGQRGGQDKRRCVRE